MGPGALPSPTVSDTSLSQAFLATGFSHAGFRHKGAFTHAQQAIQQQSQNPDPSTLPAFENSFAEYTGRAAAVYSCEVPLLAARLSAMRVADEHGLPMTVYRTADTHGWAYTNTIARVLHKAEMFVTILPTRFFFF